MSEHVRHLVEVIDRFERQRDEANQTIREMKNEITSILELMDGLAEQWGDEGVFRRCRDRLRALLAKGRR